MTDNDNDSGDERRENELPWDIGITGWKFCPHCAGEGGFFVDADEECEPDVWINCDCNMGFVQS